MRRFISTCVGLLMVSVVLCLAADVALGATVNVPGDYGTIQAAIGAATSGDEVVVASGTFHERINFGGKNITVRSTDPSDPLVVAATIIDGDGGGTVVTFKSSETASAVLAGFTITNGNAANDGGGILCKGSAPTIENNVITGNMTHGGNHGGGIFSDAASPTIQNNTIDDNVASGRGGGVGSVGGAPLVQGNLIHSNSASGGGGGLSLEGGSPTILGNTIRDNGKADKDGGGILCRKVVAGTILNNLIYANTGRKGGGISSDNSSITVDCNTICDNAATSGGGIYVNNATLVLKNSIIAFAKSGGGIVRGKGPAVTSSYSNFYKNMGGNYIGVPSLAGHDGNISWAPLFASPATGDFHERSRAGRWDPVGSTWVLDSVSSPCIDAGDPASAFANEPLPNGGCANIGCYANTAEASKTPAPTVTDWSPTGDAVDVASNISATFDTTMIRKSVNNALRINGIEPDVFGGEFTWVGRQMTFNPTSDLLPDTTYTITIRKGARSAVGVNMEGPFTWTFKTAPAPTPVAVTAVAAATASGAQITLNLTAAADVNVSIRNVAGREVAVLQGGELAAGVKTLLWNRQSKTGTRVPTGMYLVQVNANAADGTSAKAMSSLQLR